MPRLPKGWFDGTSGRWYARLGEVNPKTGKRRAVMLLGPDGKPLTDKQGKPEAQAAVGRVIEARRQAEQQRVGPTVAEVCAAFVAWHAENGSAERTVKDHHYHLTRFCLFAPNGVPNGDRPAASITPFDLWALDGNFGSLRLMYASVLACWAWAARPVKGRELVRMVPANPLAETKKPPRGKIVRKRVGWPAVRHLLRFAWGRAKRIGATRLARTRHAERLRVLLLRFLVETGCRPGEAVALEWTDLDLGKRMVAIPAERTKTRKTGRDRRFALSGRLAQALGVLSRHAAAHPRWVFVPAWSRRSRVPSAHALAEWWRTGLRPAALAAGVDIPPQMTLYYLRHDYQSTGMEVASAEEVSKVVGNSPNLLLEVYTHQGDKAAADVAARIAKRRRADSNPSASGKGRAAGGRTDPDPSG